MENEKRSNRKAVSRSPATICSAACSMVALAWGQKKRHIAVDGEILCAPKFSNSKRAALGYNSLSINGIPATPKNKADTQYTHTDGIIDFKPLEQQSGIIQKSICKQCQKKYARLF